MSYLYTFDEKRKPITLESISKISDEILESLEVLINFLENELNHNLNDSSAKRFNNAQINFPVILEEAFLDYLAENITIQSDFGNGFNPFQYDSAASDSLNAIIIIDKASKTVVKAKNVRFNSLKMFDTFLLIKIKEFLLENRINDFLLQRESNNIAVGESVWTAKYSTANLDESLTIKLKNESVKMIDFTELQPDNDSTVKFGAVSNDLEPIIYILHGNQLDYLTAVKNMMKSFVKRTKIQEVANKYKISITTITNDKQIERFDPIRND